MERVLLWGIFLRYRKGKTFCERPFCQQPENVKQNVDIAHPWKIFCGRPYSSLMYETPRFFKHCFAKAAWTSFGDLLTNPIQ